MLNSMTGFARRTAESSLGILSCEIRSVNHRYLDVQFRLPDELRAKEPEFRQQVGRAVQRGKVECSIHFQHAGADQASLNSELLAQLGRRIEEVKKLLPETRPVDPLEVLRWPGVVGEAEVESEPLAMAAVELLSDALSALAEMRSSEGRRINAMLAARCDEILKIAASVRQRMPAVLEAARAKQQERLAKIDVQADPGRLETEVALIAQKLDVEEELDRLQSHIREICDIVQATEPVGRRLDFLMQELNREANTLGSKSGDTRTTKAAVELKVLIEQMREQIQNIE